MQNDGLANFTEHFFKRDKDIYVIAYGDSIMAWQSSTVKADEGVTRVPPVCDKKGLSWYIWQDIKFGNPQYRRFDDDMDGSVFIETGVFKTYYYGNSNDYLSAEISPQITALPANEVCPICSFHESDSQKNIPKRICNEANASIQFVIPAGYEKFDFIYHTNTQGDDNIAVTISEGNGKVVVKDNNCDWNNGVEANQYLFSMKETHYAADDGYDNGILQKRLYFKKNNINDAATVKITKSSDTTKYMLYWGISYWGTVEEPNAIHLINNARGGHTIQQLYCTRFYDLAIWNADLIIFENTLLNNFKNEENDLQSNYISGLDKFISYVQSLNIEWFTLLPHASTNLVDNSKEKYRTFWNTAKWELISRNISVIDIEEAFHNLWLEHNPDREISYSKFISNLMYDGTLHGNENAYGIYNSLLRPIFDMI